MSERKKIPIADVQHDAEIEVGREDGDCLLSHTGYHEAVLALVEAVRAADSCAILTYDPRKTTQQNDELQRRAARWFKARDRFDFGDTASRPLRASSEQENPDA